MVDVSVYCANFYFCNHETHDLLKFFEVKLILFGMSFKSAHKQSLRRRWKLEALTTLQWNIRKLEDIFDYAISDDVLQTGEHS